MDDKLPTVTVSLSRRVNLGNYESADVFMSVNGVTMETTEEDINALLDGPGALAYKCVAARLKEKVAQIKGV